jgi:MFS family permease
VADHFPLQHRISADPVRWNFVANVMDGALFSFALSFVSQHTILPVLVRTIGGGNVAVGLIPVLWAFGFNFPQLVVAGRARRDALQKPLLLKTAMVQRLPWLLLAVVCALVFGRGWAEISLLLFFTIFTLAAVGGSVNLPVWFDLVAKLTPVRIRGRLFGARTILGSLLGIAGGGISAFVLAAFPGPPGFALLFLLTFLVMMGSYLFLLTLKEEKASETTEMAGRGPARIRALLRAYPAFRGFLVADGLLIASGIGAAFYTLAAMQRFDLSPAYAGAWTMVMMGSSIGASVALGFAADRRGHKINLLTAAGATVLASVLALLASSVEMYALVFVFAAIALAGTQISRLPFLAEIAPERERPILVAMANMITAPCVLLGIAGGAIADMVGYGAVFAMAGVFATAAFVWIYTRVAEPRQHTLSAGRGATEG